MNIQLQKTGRLFFGLALIGLGIEHFIFQDFITARAPAWPAALTGKLAWAYLSGAFFILAGAATIIQKKARIAIISSAIILFIWALCRNIPLLFDTAFLSGVWTLAGKALVFTGGSLAVASILPTIENNQNSTILNVINMKRAFLVAGRICLGLFLIIAGIQHFMYTAFVASLIPAWFPGGAVFWVYFAGVALIAGGVGLFIPRVTRMAALCIAIMIFSWFWIIHIPRTFTSVSDGIAVFEALAFSGIAFILAESWESAFNKLK